MQCIYRHGWFYRLRRAWALCLLLAMAACADTVTWSDGRTQTGSVETGDGAMVRLHDGKRVRAWGMAELAAITFEPATQEMQRAWVFKEAGKTAKEYSGAPYPTMELQSEVQLRSGETVHGHLLTTVLYLTSSTQTGKLVLKYKLRGHEGQSYPDLVYVTSIRIEATQASVVAAPGVAVSLVGFGAQAELALVSRERMQESNVRRSSPQAFAVRLDGGDVVPAVQQGGVIDVGWRGEATPVARARIAQGLLDLKDFFDSRQLLALSQDAHDATICHALLLLSRSNKTTLDMPQSLPWRLEVWKWRLGSETNDMTAATRCVLFRGLRAKDAPLPEIRISEHLAGFEVLTNGTILGTSSSAAVMRTPAVNSAGNLLP